MWQIALDAYAAEAEIAKVEGGARGGGDSTASCATCRRHTVFVVVAGEAGGGGEGAAAGGHVELDEWTWTSFPLCLSRGGHRPQSRGYVRQHKKVEKTRKSKSFLPPLLLFLSLFVCLSFSDAVPYLASDGGAAVPHLKYINILTFSQMLSDFPNLISSFVCELCKSHEAISPSLSLALSLHFSLSLALTPHFLRLSSGSLPLVLFFFPSSAALTLAFSVTSFFLSLL